MPDTLREHSQTVWTAVQAAIEGARVAGGTLEKVKQVSWHTRDRIGRPTHIVLAVLSRRTYPVEWGTQRGIGHMEVQFGLTGPSMLPGDKAAELETLAWALAELLMNQPRIADVCDDCRLDELSPDAPGPGPTETTEPWATVTLTWVFDFVQM